MAPKRHSFWCGAHTSGEEIWRFVFVIPAKAGIHDRAFDPTPLLDARLRGHDDSLLTRERRLRATPCTIMRENRRRAFPSCSLSRSAVRANGPLPALDGRTGRRLAELAAVYKKVGRLTASGRPCGHAGGVQAKRLLRRRICSALLLVLCRPARYLREARPLRSVARPSVAPTRIQCTDTRARRPIKAMAHSRAQHRRKRVQGRNRGFSLGVQGVARKRRHESAPTVRREPTSRFMTQ